MTAARGTRPVLLRNGSFRLLWLGTAVSVVGDYVFDTTVVLWVATVIARGSRGRRPRSAGC